MDGVDIQHQKPNILVAQEQVEPRDDLPSSNSHQRTVETKASEERIAVKRPAVVKAAGNTPLHNHDGVALRDALLQSGHHHVEMRFHNDGGGGGGGSNNRTEKGKGPMLRRGHFYHRDSLNLGHNGEHG